MAELYTVTEASERLRVSKSMIRKLARTSALPEVRIGRAVRVRGSDLDRLVAGDISTTDVTTLAASDETPSRGTGNDTGTSTRTVDHS